MKSEQRHDLKTNELANWASHLPQWLLDNQRMIIYVLIVVVVVIVGSFWFLRRGSVSLKNSIAFSDSLFQLPERRFRILSAYLQGRDISFGLIEIADQLSNTAQDSASKPMAALALIERAEALRTELHYRRRLPDRNQLTTQLNKAKEAYQNALSILTQTSQQSVQYPALTAAAMFGAGLCEEELGNFQEAEKIYSGLAGLKALENTPPAVQAAQRLITIADYQQPVAFAPAPKIEPQSMTIPAELMQSITTEGQPLPELESVTIQQVNAPDIPVIALPDGNQ